MALDSPKNGASGSGGAKKKLKEIPEANFDIVISSDDSDFEA